VGPSLVTLGVLLWATGLAAYAMAKGRASWWGVLGLLGLPALTALTAQLGLPGHYRSYQIALSLVGLIVVAPLPSRSVASSEADGSGPPDNDVW
jgi:hypothetical protein